MSFEEEESHNLVIARVKALEPKDWKGRPGRCFRTIASAISRFAKKHKVRPAEVLDRGVVLGQRKLEGLASQEYAAALKDFADAEHRKIETELQRRSLESKVRKEEADARLAEIAVVNAELELLVRLDELGVVLQLRDDKTLTVLPTGGSCNLAKLAAERLRASAEAGQSAEKLPDAMNIGPSTDVTNG